MDFKSIVENMPAMTCIVSVEKLPEGRYGKIRIVAGNRAYIDSIEHPAPGTEMLSDRFVPNSEYTDYLTRDLNFEDYCYRAAVEKKCLHSYVHPDRMNVWLNMTFLPFGADEGDLCYCFYIMEINPEADSGNLSNISPETASAVLDTCIRLRGTNDFKATIKDVIAEIRKLCDAEHCCILVLNELERSCYVLAEAFREGSALLPMETYLNDEFYDIADSWIATIAGSNCLIVKNEHDMDIVRERNPVWYESLRSAGARNIVLFPLKSRNQLLGYMWALNYDQGRAVKIKETLEVTTFILGSELGNYLLLDRLRLISSKDMLTGTLNRNEMNNVVDELSDGSNKNTSVGVVFADLNGLKTVNDVEGHNAGDMLLKRASSILREVFDPDQIYRAGGDEFAMILTDITEAELNERIEKVKELCDKSTDVSFALGGAVEKDSSNVRMALRRADERMYEDKRRYYADAPEKLEENRRNRSVMQLSEEKLREQNIFREMNYDTLTGLPSMSYFFRLAEEGRKKMHEKNIPSALLFFNLNGIKYYNKKYGFTEGDVLIKELGRVIAGQFGEERSSRFGQDHFAVFTEEEGSVKKIIRVFRRMKSANGGKSLPVRVGIYPDSMGMVETSVACDRAKYACSAKKDDHNSYYIFFDDKMLTKELNRQYVVDNLDRALAENWIRAFYQPIVRASGRKVCDEEALARWIDPEKGMLSPADFIPALEDTRLIYKVDLRIVDIVLEKLKNQRLAGLHAVPVSVNLSRTDFEMCDIVDEICNRVDAAGVPRDLITIEITESVIGEDFGYMKEQIERFQKLGFQVWMDDFGSGYSSLDLLQELQFDLIKFDMRFMRQFEKSPKSRVILTELMRMAVSLNIETVTEGVETKEQVDFLCAIGCTKMQGYYFCKPVPYEEVLKRNKKGIQIGFENPAESEYHRIVSSLNLYDLGAVSSEDSESIRQYFNTQPMAVLEFDGENIAVSRANKAYREFVVARTSLIQVNETRNRSELRTELGKAVLNGLVQCTGVGQRVFVNEPLADGDTVHALLRKVSENPVTGVSAYALALLGVTPKSEEALTFTGVARALSADYIDLYHVDLETEKFKEFSSDADSFGMSVEKSGDDFFKTARDDAIKYLYKDDQDVFLKAFTKQNVIKALDEHGAFTHTYRLIMDGVPQYVNMKAVRMGKDEIIIGISNVDGQMRQQETLERLREETVTYSRISALMGDFIVIYTVDPVTGNYMQYSASHEFSDLQTSKAGIDFFEASKREGAENIYSEDLDRFMSGFTREKVLEKTGKGEVYIINYRLVLSGKPVGVCLRAGLVQEKDGPQLIVGVSPSQ